MNAVIAGGFALALFTGELYSASDIDIYVPSDRRKHHLRNVRTSGLKRLLKTTNYNHVKTSKNDEYQYYPHGFREYENFDVNKKIQVLYHNIKYKDNMYSHPGDSVVSDYDFTTVMCYVQLSRNSIIFCCKNLNDVINKTIKINVNCSKLQNMLKFQMSCVIRLLKYQDRGFILCKSMKKFLPIIDESLKLNFVGQQSNEQQTDSSNTETDICL